MRHERIFNLLFAPFCNPAHSLIGGLRLAESQCSAVIARSTHSSLHLGVGLRILLATRDISPFCCLSTATRPPNWDFITSNHLPALFWFSKKIPLTLTGLRFAIRLWTFSLCRQTGRQQQKSIAFQQRGLWVFVRFWGDRLDFFVGAKSMGAQLSKAPGKAETAAEKPGEAAASPTKTNGQVNEI